MLETRVKDGKSGSIDRKDPDGLLVFFLELAKRRLRQLMMHTLSFRSPGL